MDKHRHTKRQRRTGRQNEGPHAGTRHTQMHARTHAHNRQADTQETQRTHRKEEAAAVLVLGVQHPFSGRLGVQRRRVALPLVPLTPAVPQSTRNLKGGSREPADGPRVHSQGAPRPLFSAPEPPNRTAGPPHTPGSRLRQKSAPGDRTMPRRAVTVARRQEHPPLLRGSDRAHSTGGGSWCCNRPARPAEAPTARTTSAPNTVAAVSRKAPNRAAETLPAVRPCVP